MMTRRQWFIEGAAVVAVLMCWAGSALAQPFPGGLPRCQANLNTCSANLGACSTQLSACQAAAQQFPATGKTTCLNISGEVIPCQGTGQDGDIQAGATLSYTDNGDGTITDNNTKLVWEKKSSDGTIHDFHTVYTWADAFAVHVAGLNATNFAGHNDWRLPNVKELQSIVNYGDVGPGAAVSTEFNNNCTAGITVLAGSCSAGSLTWSSTPNPVAGPPAKALFVTFSDGRVDAVSQSNTFHVRAVRGGSP